MTDAEREADLKRSAALLARHSINTVLEMAKEEKATRATVAAMLSCMANAHRAAADLIDKAALSATLKAAGR